MSFLISLVFNREKNRRGADIGSYVLISFAKFAFCDLPFIDELFKKNNDAWKMYKEDILTY